MQVEGQSGAADVVQVEDELPRMLSTGRSAERRRAETGGPTGWRNPFQQWFKQSNLLDGPVCEEHSFKEPRTEHNFLHDAARDAVRHLK